MGFMEEMSATYGINWPMVVNPVYMPPQIYNPYTKEAKRLYNEQQLAKREAFRRKYPDKARKQRVAYAAAAKKAKAEYRTGGVSIARYSRRGTKKKTRKRKK